MLAQQSKQLYFVVNECFGMSNQSVGSGENPTNKTLMQTKFELLKETNALKLRVLESFSATQHIQLLWYSMAFIQAKCQSQAVKGCFESCHHVSSVESAINDLKVIADMKCLKFERFVSKSANKHELVELLNYVRGCVVRSE